MIFLPAETEVTVKNEMSVLEVALKNEIELDHSCGGSGSCGTCRIFLNWHGKDPPRGDVEAAMAEDRKFSANERLACQIEPEDGMIISIPTSAHKLDW